MSETVYAKDPECFVNDKAVRLKVTRVKKQTQKIKEVL